MFVSNISLMRLTFSITSVFVLPSLLITRQLSSDKHLLGWSLVLRVTAKDIVLIDFGMTRGSAKARLCKRLCL